MIPTWKTFAENNFDDVYAIGIGSEINLNGNDRGSLNQIADLTNGHEPFIVGNINDLTNEMLATIVNINGQLVINSGGNKLDFSFGADGPADGTGIKKDGDKFAFSWGDSDLSDGVGVIINNNDGSAPSLTWLVYNNGKVILGKDINTGEILIKLEAKDILSDNPTYEVTQFKANTGINKIEIPYTVVDGDGDSSTATLTINIDYTKSNTPPEAEDRHFELDCPKDDVYTIGLKSEYYGVNTQINNLTQFKSIVSSNNPDATFTATKIDYGQGSGDVGRGTNLQTFLKGDASSLSNDPSDTTDGGIHMYGKVFLTAGSYNFKVYADDGYDILINGQSVASFENNQAPATKVHDQFTIAQDGYYDIEMFWWDQGGVYVFKPEISSDGGITYKTLDSSMLFTQTDDPANNTNNIEFTLEDFVSDVEDDANSTVVKIKIVSLPEDGVLTVGGNPVKIGDIYDETVEIKYTANDNSEDTLYGTLADTGTISDWGTITNGVLVTNDGKATIKAFTAGQEIDFASENNNYSHDGLGIGVDSSSGDDDQIDKLNDEKIVIEFKTPVSNAEFGLASLGDHFKSSPYDAKAQWVAKDANGNVVASGFVQQSTDDSNPYTNSFKVDVEFSSIEFFTTSNASNSNFSIQYMNIDYKVDDSFDYVAIDSDGFESEKATVTFDIDSKGNIIPKTTNDSIITDEDTSYTIKVEDFGNYSDSSTSSFIKVMIVDLPTNGVLKLNGAVISENTEILKSDIDSGNLVFEPNSQSDVDGSFTFKVSNGTNYSEINTVSIDIKAVADKPTATIEVKEIEIVTGSNLIENGSFEDISGKDANGNVVASDYDISSGGLVTRQEITGWKVVEGKPMEPHDKAHAGVGSTDGDNYMDLGASPGNSTIAQTINGLVEGQVYSLSVDYLDKAAKQGMGLDSGKMEVIWNGKVIATIDGNNTENWETLKIDLTAGSGDKTDTLQFKEIGSNNDNGGIALDNVQLIEIPSDNKEYDVNISAALGADNIDGSEILTVKIDGVPSNATLTSSTYTLTKNADGSWTVEVPNGVKSIEDNSIKLVTPKDTPSFDLTITARATETNDNNDGLNYKESSDLANVVSPFDVKLGSANTLVTQVSTSTTQGAISKPARLEDIENVNTTVIGDTVTTYENMNLAHYSNSGNFNDVIEVNGNSNYIETRGGNDTINVDGNQNGTIDAGEGNNRIDIDGNAGTIYVGNNDDSIRIGSNANSSIDLREGTNIIDVLGNSNSIYSGSGNDTIIVDGSVNGVISSGYGADRIDIGGNVSDMIDSNDGDDVVTIGGTTHSSVYLGGGNDILEITGNADQNIDAGTGNDTIAVKGHVNGYIDLAAGGDTLYTSDYVNGIIFAGEGNDSVILGGYIKNDVRGGSGADSIELTKYSKIDWDTNKDGVKDKVQEFENIKFSDGTIIGNLSAFSSSMTTYEYPVVVSILNNDLDSETITEVKVSFENLPIDGKIYQNGVELIPNNGEYTLNANDLTNIKISSSEQILDESGFKINVCATSTESNGGNIAIKNLNTLFIGDEDNDDTIDFSTAINNKTDIDVVDIKGTNVNTKLKIDIEDLVADTDKELIIKGEFEGKVDLNDGNDGQKSWENSGTENLDGSTYNVYIGTGVNSTVKLLIEDDIEIIPDI